MPREILKSLQIDSTNSYEEEVHEIIQKSDLGKHLELLPSLFHSVIELSSINFKKEQNRTQVRTELLEIIKNFTDLMVVFQEQEQSRVSAVEGIRAITTTLSDEQRQRIEVYLDLIQPQESRSSPAQETPHDGVMQGG